MTTLKALFVSNDKMMRCLFGMYSFCTHRRFVNLRNVITQAVLVSIKTMRTDCTEINHVVRIEICLSNDSNTVVPQQQQMEALFVSITTKCGVFYPQTFGRQTTNSWGTPLFHSFTKSFPYARINCIEYLITHLTKWHLYSWL